MDDQITLATWIRKEAEGEFDKNDIDCMIEAGWFDWFCQDSSLYRRLGRMKGMVKAAAASRLVDTHNTYVFFRNNQPLCGRSYDSFSICDMNGDVLYWVTAKSGDTGEAEVCYKDNLDQNLLEPGGNANDVKRFFRGDSPAYDAHRQAIK